MATYILERTSIGDRLFSGSKLLAQRSKGGVWISCPTHQVSRPLGEVRFYELDAPVAEKILGQARPPEVEVDEWDIEFLGHLLVG